VHLLVRAQGRHDLTVILAIVSAVALCSSCLPRSVRRRCCANVLSLLGPIP
jgi:hypothetical protein